jgi:hypothetical protein
MKLLQFSKLIAISTVSSAVCFLAVGKAEAVSITLDFEGVGNNNQVLDFYNGGAGTNYGISFDSNAQASVDKDAGGTGQFANEPSPSTVLDAVGTGTKMNVAGGFVDTLSFFYTAGTTNQTGSVSIFDGLDGTGNLLASLILPLTPAGSGDPNGGPRGGFNTFVLQNLSFNGIARSVNFGITSNQPNTANQVLFDNVSLNTTGSTSVPEPFTVIGTLVGGTAAFRMRKKLKSGNDKM